MWEDCIEVEYEKDENGKTIYDENGKPKVKATYVLTPGVQSALYDGRRKPQNPGEEAYVYRALGEQALRSMRYE